MIRTCVLNPAIKGAFQVSAFLFGLAPARSSSPIMPVVITVSSYSKESLDLRRRKPFKMALDHPKGFPLITIVLAHANGAKTKT